MHQANERYEKLKLNIRRLMEFEDKEYEDVVR